MDRHLSYIGLIAAWDKRDARYRAGAYLTREMIATAVAWRMQEIELLPLPTRGAARRVLAGWVSPHGA